MIRGNMRTSKYLKLSEIICVGPLTAKWCPYVIMQLYMSHLIVLCARCKHVLIDETMLNNN